MLYARSSCREALVLALAFAAAACGDNHDTPMPDAPGAPPDAGFDEDGCRILTVGQRDFQFNIFGQLLGLRYPVTPNLDGERSDVLRIELYDSTTPDLPPLTTGTFDLSTMTDLGTCQHCVWVEVDENEDGFLDAIYIATQGTLTLDLVNDPLEPIFTGRTSRVVLRRAQVDETGHSTLVPGGDCVSISELDFDTSVTPGKACESAEDCGNPIFEICDPSTNTCAAPECNFDQPCEGAGEICLIQYGELFHGACYQSCDPSAATSPCAADQRCVQRGPDPTWGICKYVGTGELGSPCELEDNTTSCKGEAVCSGESYRCVAPCDFYGDDSSCPGVTKCSLFNLCEPLSTGVPVKLGEACGPDADLAQSCAADSDAFRGICFGFEGDPLTCEKTCFGDRGCSDGEFCAQRFTSGVGICLPLPVCGDGKRGEINEVCDDGNTEDGDGCSSDCQIVDVDYLCANAATLALGASTSGDTSIGIDGMASSCQSLEARADLYEVTPPGPGRLRLHLTSDSAQSISLRTTCADVGSELGCESDPGPPTDEELIVQITDTNPATLTAMVSAMNVVEEGPYTLAAEFVPEDCGDGIIAGREVCDDKNTSSNDGCSGDCRTIEYDALCTLAPTLSTSATNADDLAGAPPIYAASCNANEGAVLHPSQLYRFVAPAAGTLHLKLVDDGGLAVLSVRDGCGAPDTAPELACWPGFLGGEIDIALDAGQAITAIVVSYFTADKIGGYTLEATFTPQ